MGDPQRTIRAVERASQIIGVLRDEGQLGVTQLSSKLEMSKGTIHTHLVTLSEEGFVTQANGKYQLSLRLLGLSEQVTDRIEIYDLVREQIDRLAEETGERAQFSMMEDDMVITVYRAEGEEAIRATVTIGTPQYPHSIAVGKAMIAYLPDHRIDEIVEKHGLPKHTENTIVDVADLKTHLEEIRSREYAIDNEERIRGVRCIGTPLRDDSGRVLGGISISSPARRMSDERIETELKERLLRTANVIEVNAELSE